MFQAQNKPKSGFKAKTAAVILGAGLSAFAAFGPRSVNAQASKLGAPVKTLAAPKLDTTKLPKPLGEGLMVSGDSVYKMEHIQLKIVAGKVTMRTKQYNGLDIPGKATTTGLTFWSDVGQGIRIRYLITSPQKDTLMTLYSNQVTYDGMYVYAESGRFTAILASQIIDIGIKGTPFDSVAFGRKSGKLSMQVYRHEMDGTARLNLTVQNGSDKTHTHTLLTAQSADMLGELIRMGAIAPIQKMERAGSSKDSPAGLDVCLPYSPKAY